MKKILVFGFTDNIGGIETFFMTYYRKFDKKQYQFDFATIYDKMVFEDEIKNNGGKVYKLTSFKKNVFKYKKEIKRILDDNKYDIVYANMLSAANILPIKIAKKQGVKKIIVHSHNSSTPKNVIKMITDIINKNKISKYANVLLACSNKAGAWMFRKNKYVVLNNAIDVKKFSFNEKYANEREIKFAGKKVIGHVGRFCETKNQDFIIDFFKDLNSKNKDYSLYLIGNGDDKEKIKKKIKKLELENYVNIIDNTQDVYKYYSQFDLFILPSKFEGLPIVGIEAQANGLPCLFSDTITKELKINDNVKFLSINNNEEWVKEIIKSGKRTDKIKLKDSGYDINYNYKKLEKILNES